jgi:hypothetical protein
MKSRKGTGKKKKKKQAVYNYKYPQLDFEKLKQVPTLNFMARNLNSRASDIIEGSVPIDFSFNKIKEIIQAKHKFSCGNLRLYILEGQEKKYLDNVICRTFKELGITAEKFTLYYEFEPFVHPMLEASLA